MNHEPEVIRARFVEAAFTERYLANAMMPTARGYWPVMLRDAEDYKGYDDQAWLDNASKRLGRASSAAISRHQECLDWTGDLIHDEKRRHIVWTWAFCKANGWDFGASCVKRGWARPTAYRRLMASIDAISVHFDISGVVVRLPDDKWLRQDDHTDVDDCATVKNYERTPLPFTPPAFISEKSTDMLTTPEAIEAFVAHIEDVNSARRRMQARRFGRSNGAGNGVNAR